MEWYESPHKTLRGNPSQEAITIPRTPSGVENDFLTSASHNEHGQHPHSCIVKWRK